jgi:hypothetical protein
LVLQVAAQGRSLSQPVPELAAALSVQNLPLRSM